MTRTPPSGLHSHSILNPTTPARQPRSSSCGSETAWWKPDGGGGGRICITCPEPIFRFRHVRVQQPFLSGWVLYVLSSPLLHLSPQLPLPCSQREDMSVPGPPSPDGVLTGPPDGMEYGEPTSGFSDTSPDEGLIEDMMVEDKAVEQLAEGLLSHYLPDLQRSKQALQELTQNQVVLLDTLEQEISKFKECHSMLDINALFTEAKHYHAKLVNIRKEMLMLHEKTSKLKKRALKLQQKRQKEELEREQQREKEFEREKQLTAKPAKRT
ncbi:biogenesis of lysosome-related organelles complex 1 subunit 6 [Manis javanica]|uniref:biogenesis of lysosome-related organelles complex 1 subunit 6 n=1 Tax=Manis javanica TaxID=9974 RepID=UPI003C6CD1D3